MATEDFSFPTFTDTVSSAIDSPPLWRLSPAASPDHSCHYRTSKNNQEDEEEENSSDNEDEEEEYKDCFPINTPNKNTQRKSFSLIEKANSRLVKSDDDDDDDDDDDEEEKMDMLWEDFNEELSIERNYGSSNHHQSMVNMGSVQSLRLSNRNSTAMVSARKSSTTSNSAAGFVVFIKVLKKFFLLHNSHNNRSVQNHCSNTRRPKNLSW